ncbi:toll/interleukin-1 receptor domain-containing protein [Pseudomonas oryzihabitans]|uniref:toll/interleukin-1 receptor domain-containing protein n=1 Tax=Pseudomonas oryzihabitans TaxID=47885 RepID=UPI00391731DC
MGEKVSPKLFISYSWSSLDHEQWVADLAIQLAHHGVHVLFDKWDLREGDSTHAFMERMVTDPDVKKVIMICDSSYAEKADKRAAGVGTETQIISRSIYDNEDPGKFAAVLASS